MLAAFGSITATKRKSLRKIFSTLPHTKRIKEEKRVGHLFGLS